MIVPLGPVFASQVLGAGSGGYGLLMTAMGVGATTGVVVVSILQKRLPLDKTFVIAIVAAGASLAGAATMDGLGAAAMLIGLLGVCAGALYVLGFTILQVSVSDEYRGRVFVSFYTVTRLALLLALVTAPLLSLGLDHLSKSLIEGSIGMFGQELALPGVRLTLWMGAGVIIAAGFLAARPMRRIQPQS